WMKRWKHHYKKTTKSKFGVKQNPAIMKMKRKRRHQLDAVLEWIHGEPLLTVPDKGSEPYKHWKKNDGDDRDCQKECGYITEDEPERTYPPP
ncbi:hypothetical protein A2U01_0071195, partial [Trifolium medium]|nr:hypothetical protein [Trifolium medium]